MVRGPNKQLKIGGVVIDSAESVFLNKIDLHSRLRGCKFSLLCQRLVHSFHTIVPILGFGLQKPPRQHIFGFASTAWLYRVVADAVSICYFNW